LRGKNKKKEDYETRRQTKVKEITAKTGRGKRRTNDQKEEGKNQGKRTGTANPKKLYETKNPQKQTDRISN